MRNDSALRLRIFNTKEDPNAFRKCQQPLATIGDVEFEYEKSAVGKLLNKLAVKDQDKVTKLLNTWENVLSRGIEMQATFCGFSDEAVIEMLDIPNAEYTNLSIRDYFDMCRKLKAGIHTPPVAPPTQAVPAPAAASVPLDEGKKIVIFRSETEKTMTITIPL